ncbi:MAG TPA: TIGR02281 family clan AA aspartic protease [Caulobacteraceae bacterium]|nr:TIGR02281 family clan AA aspartic protease [Caulobacteraceae bacterium]
MIRLAVIAAVGTLSAVGMAQGLMRQTATAQDAAAPSAAARAEALRGPEASEAADRRSADLPGGAAELTKAPDGQYWTQASVDGTAVRFLVDTGATEVALTDTDAQRLGLAPSALAYTVPVHTANGDSRAARVHLASLSVAGARVDDVDALVVQHGLTTSLLGMSYLGRLSQFEATPRALILRP